jgi:DNA adenine methylase
MRRSILRYYQYIRNLDRQPAYATHADVDKAARMIYLNKTCFNGLYRVNSRGYFNVPMGRYINPMICDSDTLHAVHTYLTTAQLSILHGDYRHAVADAPAGSLVYFDPPYHSPDKQNFTSYHADGFDEADQITLADTFRDLSARGVYCVLSNADTALIRELYSGYTVHTVAATRAINSNHTARGAINEVLIHNW